MSNQPPPPPPPPGGYEFGGQAGPGLPPLAEFGPRIVAYLIDWIAPWFALWILLFIVGAISDALGLLLGIVGWLAVIGFWVWNLYRQGTTGQTIGKEQQGIRLVRIDDGQPVGAGMSFVRYLVNALPCGLGWFLAFVDSQRQTLGDKVSNSVVVQ